MQHTNQSNYLRFFYDAMETLRNHPRVMQQNPDMAKYVAAHKFCSVAIDYLREATATDDSVFHAVLERPAQLESGQPPYLDAYFVSDGGGMHCRARYWALADISEASRL